LIVSLDKTLVDIKKKIKWVLKFQNKKTKIMINENQNLILPKNPRYLIARAGLHFYEEPPISGNSGSGTIFFGGCSLKCVFCQNRDISHTAKGLNISQDDLILLMLHLQEQGAHNINLVTPSHYVKCLIVTLQKAKPKLKIPIVYNTSCYENAEQLKLLDGLVDIYLPDFKYVDETIAVNFSKAKDYFPRACTALKEMLRQQPKNVMENGLLKKGVVVRHLVLPGQIEDTKRVLDYLSKIDNIHVSLMGQYFPPIGNLPSPLNRRLTAHEYKKATEYMRLVGIKNGWTQELSSATKDYVPDFDLNQLENLLNDLRGKNLNI